MIKYKKKTFYIGRYYSDDGLDFHFGFCFDGS